MPTPISHIAYAMQAQPGFSGSEQEQFWLGSVFPDIRHIGILKRTDTHHGVDPDSLPRITNPFLLGSELHNWIDLRREELAHDVGLYRTAMDWPEKTATKFLEDEQSGPRFSGWNDVAAVFRRTDTLDLYPDLPTISVAAWYQALAVHIGAGTTTASAVALLQTTTATSGDIERVATQMDTLRRDPDIQAALLALTTRLASECASLLSGR